MYPHQRPRRPLRSFLAKALLILATAGVIWGLASLPYDILRVERIRAFGEQETRGVVLSVAGAEDQDGRPVVLVEYEYRDGDGVFRQARALFSPEHSPIPKPGDDVSVFYARGNPNIVRLEGQIEPWLQEHLRKFLSR